VTKRPKSERVILNAPMSFAGNAQRASRLVPRRLEDFVERMG